VQYGCITKLKPSISTRISLLSFILRSKSL
jgi:hypothetical protein